jgi:thiol-disulfide isomerase/thioredoxin
MTLSSTRRVPAKVSAQERRPWHGRRRGAVFTILLLAQCTAGPALAQLEAWQQSGPPPALALKALDGRLTTLADGSGTVVLVHFFATWCEPCRAELAALDTLGVRLEPKGLKILAVDVGEPESRVRRFFEAQPTSVKIVLDPERQAMRAWGVDVLPTSFVLGRGACPRWIAMGEHDWAAAETLTALAAALDASPTPTCNSRGDQP